MALANYSDLQASIALWLNRSDLTEPIKDFIRIAESRLQDVLRVRPMITRTTLAVSSRYTTLPDDFLEMNSVHLGAPYFRKVEVLNTEQMAELRELHNDASGYVTHFAVVGDEIECFPTPSAATTLDITYYQQIPALSDAAPTNGLIAQYPELLLFGALICSAPYIYEDERFPLWIQAHDARLEEANAAAQTAKWGGSTPAQRFRPIG